MTFSIVAHDPDTESWGVAVATCYLAVGAMVPVAEFGVGALATQAQTNIAYRGLGIAVLRDGYPAKDVITALRDGDEQREQRQVGIVDGIGQAATWTGAECEPFASGVTGDGYAIQGNLLTGPEVIEAMEHAWVTGGSTQPLAEQLLAALTAGDAAGGDRRGRQSAALYVVSRAGGLGVGTHVEVDLRVDDSSMPIPELERLLSLRRQLSGEE